ncbi:MAG: hypothetical protein PHX93_05985 [Candidatus Peribacteraceae bacterium]|jgi:hypothetical protein|nr:hypothetical protein [Candidatus Peribacteraceae bacterium]
MDTTDLERGYREGDLQIARQAAERTINELRQKEKAEISVIQSLTQMQCDKVTAYSTTEEFEFQLALRLLQENNPIALAHFERCTELAQSTGTGLDRHQVFSRLVGLIALLHSNMKNLQNPSPDDIGPFAFGRPGCMQSLVELGWVRQVYITKYAMGVRKVDSPPRGHENDYTTWFDTTEEGEKLCSELRRHDLVHAPRVPRY